MSRILRRAGSWLALVVATPLMAQSWAGSAPASARGLAASMILAGNELFVGRTGGFGVGTGDVLVYRRGVNGKWAPGATFTGSSLEIGDGFAATMALDGNTLAIGAAGSKGGGAVYLFERRGTTWRELKRLTQSDTSRSVRFGQSLAMVNGLLLVGAPGIDSARGAVFAFRRNPRGAWGDGVVVGRGTEATERFGTSVALDRTRAAVGAPGVLSFGPNARRLRGTVVLYDVSRTGTLTESGRLMPAEEDSITSFGASIRLDGETLLAGAPAADRGMGYVYIYRHSTDGWSVAQRLTPPEDMPNQAFGLSLMTAGKQILVGAPFSNRGEGLVHVFSSTPDGWYEDGRLSSGLSGGFIQFGGLMSLSGDRLAIGAPGADFGEGIGFVFRRSGGGWAEEARLLDQPNSLKGVAGNELKCDKGKASAFDCGQVDLESFIPVADLGAKRGIELNDLWGWTDPESGREYALVGRSDGTVFVDVTDATHPVYLGELPLHEGARPNVWRDIKVYKDHAFIVADGAGPHGMQVFDLARLRNVPNRPATFTEDAHYDKIASAHNIVINEATGYAYTVGNSGGGETCGGALHMIDIRDPMHPTFAGCFADPATGIQRTGYTHDAECVTYHGPDTRYQGREICFNSSETAVGIADVTDKDNPKKVAVASYPNTAYAHQGWLNEDQTHFFLDDEGDEIQGSVPKTRTLVWDVTNLEEPVLVKEFLGETSASDHNLYIKGNLMYQSNYVAGLRVVDVSNPGEPREVGFFDTVPVGENTPGFAGSWSNYPFFKSGNIVVTSGREGLFVLRYRPQQGLVP